MSEISGQPAKYPAIVVKVEDRFTVVINRGSEHNVHNGDEFLIYRIDDDEIIDPQTGDSLGRLEIVKGTGAAIHVQPKLTTIKSNRTLSKGRKVVRRENSLTGSLLAALNPIIETIEEPEHDPVPFDEIQKGDYAKPI